MAGVRMNAWSQIVRTYLDDHQMRPSSRAAPASARDRDRGDAAKLAANN